MASKYIFKCDRSRARALSRHFQQGELLSAQCPGLRVLWVIIVTECRADGMLLSSYPAGTAPTQQARAGANCIKPREGRTSNTWTPETRWSVRHEVSEITQFGSALGCLWFAYELYPCVLGWNVTAVSAPCVTVLCKSTTHLQLTVPRSSLDHCYSPRPPPLISANFAGALQLLLLQHCTIGPLIAGWWPPDGSIYR